MKRIKKTDIKVRKFLDEFKAFAIKGNMVDMAVGVIIGGAFSKIVSALAQKIIMPIVGLFIGGIDISKWVVEIPNFIYGGEPVKWEIGSFINSVIDFLIIALVIFIMIKAIGKLRSLAWRRDDAQNEQPKTKKCPYCCEEVDINAVRCPHCTSQDI